MTRYPRLSIVHNHGVLYLADATVDSTGMVRGTVVSGHSTNRLFHASSTTHEIPGAEATWPLYGRTPRQTYLGNTVNGVWTETPIPGEYVVNCTYC